MITIRQDRPEGADILFQVYLAAFGRLQEAALVDFLREKGGLLLSLVTSSEVSLVGGVAFSPLTLEADGQRSASGRACSGWSAAVPGAGGWTPSFW
jgi:predicted N-acetyltransferase YhbS